MVNGLQSLDCFDFHNYFPSNQKIQPVPAIDQQSLVYDRKHHLTLVFELVQRKLMSQAILIRRFRQSWTERLMNFDCSSDNLICNGV